jgi:phosphatidylserine/phosphatidylglycerophosphate/cardiolipin synthase-like enzyme
MITIRNPLVHGHRALIRSVCAALLTLAAAVPAAGQTGEIEIVESIPDETTLDNPEIRNTAAVWLDMIHDAGKSIAIEQFYVSNKSGEALEPVVLAIEAAASRGVAIRVIVDKKFYKTYPETVDRWNAVQNIECRVVDFTAVSKGAVQHAKFFVVDQSEVFVGSQNFDWRSLAHIHEIGVRVRQAAVAREFLKVFEMDWILAGTGDTAAARSAVQAGIERFPAGASFAQPALAKQGKDATGHVEVTPVFSPSRFLPEPSLWDGAALSGLIAHAEHDIAVHVMSYSAAGDFELDQALRSADTRGIKVRLLIADWSLGLKRLPSLFALQALPNVEVRYTAIPAHSSGFISFARVEHCKYMIIDGRTVWIGTNNWSKDYFESSRNAGVVISGIEPAAVMLRVFETSWRSRYASDLDPDKQYVAPKTDDGSGK